MLADAPRSSRRRSHRYFDDEMASAPAAACRHRERCLQVGRHEAGHVRGLERRSLPRRHEEIVAPPLFHRLLIANRGEVAVRVARACDALASWPCSRQRGRRAAPYTKDARSSSSARGARAVVPRRRARRAGRRPGALLGAPPGWASVENPLLATLCAQHGVTFIGPRAGHRADGQQDRAKRRCAPPGCSDPGSAGVLTGVADASASRPSRVSRAVQGGERRRRPRHADRARARRVEHAYGERRRGRAAFGGDRVFLERLIEDGRHVEIQIFGDPTVAGPPRRARLHVQRNHQS